MKREPQELQSQEPAQEPEPQPESREVPPPTPPEELKPWYYQYWFLYPTIIFWPLWPVLIIRSPWHNGLVSGAIAWAMLISGGYLVYQGTGGREVLTRLLAGDRWAIFTVQLILPGLIFILITQTHWLRNRRRIMAAATATKPAPTPAKPPGNANPPRRRQRNANRRRHRRR